MSINEGGEASNSVLKPVSISLFSLVASTVLFFTWMMTASFRVESAQPNGLAEIAYPYSGISLFALLAAVGLLLFSITFGLAIHSRGPRKPMLGSGLVSFGALAILFSLYWALANYSDEQPRCFDGCPATTLSYYNEVYVAWILLSACGITAIVLGARMLRRSVSEIKES